MPKTLNKVKIVNKGDDVIPTNIYINDEELHRVTNVEYFSVGVGEVPTFRFTVNGQFDFCQINKAHVELLFAPDTVDDALKFIWHELDTNEEMKSAYLKDIEEIISDDNFFDTKQKAKILLERIFGEVKGDD